MGNNMGGSKKSAKVMKINGELIKLNTPAKVYDVIKDYPHHILLDSTDFLRFNIRADPLDPDHQLKPNKTYLLVQLPQLFPTSIRRVRSDVGDTMRDIVKINRRSPSTASTASDDFGFTGSPLGPTRVRIRMSRPVVERIMAECRDEKEVAKRILRLYLEDGNGGDVTAPVMVDGGECGEERERAVVVVAGQQCCRVGCSSCRSLDRKYGKLSC